MEIKYKITSEICKTVCLSANPSVYNEMAQVAKIIEEEAQSSQSSKIYKFYVNVYFQKETETEEVSNKIGQAVHTYHEGQNDYDEPLLIDLYERACNSLLHKLKSDLEKNKEPKDMAVTAKCLAVLAEEIRKLEIY